MLFSKIIKKKFDAVLGRYGEDPFLYYFSLKDFPDMKHENFNIQGDKGLLYGNFYYFDKFDPDKFIIFDHGIGAGHLAYFKEIAYLADKGYTVYSYDHTGCVESEGPGITGFAQGISDLDHVVSALKKEDRLKGKKIKVMGHSWGGYSAMNVAVFHPEITHIVSLAGFLSARSLIEQYLPDFVMKYSDEVMDRERINNPEYADLDARESMKHTEAKLFFVQSEDDQMVKYKLCGALLEEALKNRKDTVFVTLKGRGHNPQYSDRAVLEYDKMKREYTKITKHKRPGTKKEQDDFKNRQDWELITEQDDRLWGKILGFLTE